MTSPGTTSEQMLLHEGGAVVGLGASLDFQNGIYSVLGISVDITDIIDDPTDSRIVPGSGLEMIKSPHNGGTAEILEVLPGDFLDLLLTLDWTIYIEYQNIIAYNTDLGSAKEQFLIMYRPAYAGLEDECSVWTQGGYARAYERRTPGTFVDRSLAAVTDPIAPFPAAGNHKIAFSRASDKFLISQDGTTPTSPDTADETTVIASNALVGAVIGDASGNFSTPKAYLKKFEVIVPRLTAAEMAALTTGAAGMAAAAGNFQMVGSSVGLLSSSVSMAAAAGNFQVVGSSVGLGSSVSMAAAVGNFQVVGSSVGLSSSVSMAAAVGNFQVVGSSVGLSSSLWTPTEISTLMWLDADDAGTFTFGTGVNVAQWNDKSGNGNHVVQATSGNQPDRDSSTNTIGGLPVVSFDGTDDRLQRNSLSGWPANNGTAVTIAAVWRQRSAVGNLAFFDISTGSLTNETGLLFHGSSFQLILRATGISNAANSAAFAFVQNVAFQFACTVKSDKREIFVNGTANGANTTNNGTSAYTNLRLASLFQDVFPMLGDLGEFVVVSGDDDTTRQLIEGYLAWKWGLQGDLPAGHPYENAAP
jgi:hypothetical protein